MRPNGRRFLLCTLGSIAFAISSPAEAACSIAKSAELPVTMVDGVPAVAVTVNGKPARFRVNSGFFFSQIEASQVDRFGLTPNELARELVTSKDGKEATLGG